MKEDFICPKCKATFTYIETKGTQTGLYCGSCAKWIKWLNKDEKRQYELLEKNNSENGLSKENIEEIKSHLSAIKNYIKLVENLLEEK